MVTHIPENILEEVLSRTDIVELISSYIPLKRTGRNFKAACPFHHEKTPSFVVSADKQIYHCFGCGAGGNVFNFLMQYERLEFREVVEMLARKAGIVLPEKQKNDAHAVSLNTQLYKINELAAQFFAHTLLTQEGSAAKQYLLKRGISLESIELFKIGYALDKWDALITHLRSKGIGLNLLEKAGLVLPRDGGGYYDRFRNRVIFPIMDIKGRVIAFGARVLTAHDASVDKQQHQPKYLNSPETPVYIKGKHLYGLHLAKESLRDAQCIAVVEGYLDFIMPYQHGFLTMGASLGTALTEDQVRLIKRYTHNVVMVYDADMAGEMAALRSLELFLDEDMQVSVVALPEGVDPDVYVRTHGVGKFKELIGNALSLFDFKMKMLKKRYSITDAYGKKYIAHEMLGTIAHIKNEILKAEYIKKLSEALSVDEQYVVTELHKIKTDKPNTLVLKEKPFEGGRLAIAHPTEKLLVKLMLEESSVINRLRQTLEPADFQDDKIGKIVSLMFEMIDQGRQVDCRSILNECHDDTVSKLVCESVFLPELTDQERQDVVDDCIKRLKQRRLTWRRESLHKQIKEAQDSGDEEQVHRLLKEFDCLMRKR